MFSEFWTGVWRRDRSVDIEPMGDEGMFGGGFMDIPVIIGEELAHDSARGGVQFCLKSRESTLF